MLRRWFRRLWSVCCRNIWNGVQSSTWNISIQVQCSCSSENLYRWSFSRRNFGKNIFITDLNGGNIKKQCSPLASDSLRWGWHTSVRMPLVHFITNRIAVWAFFSIIQVLCLLPPPLFFRWCYNVTISSTRHAGFLKSACGHQQCYDGTPQDGSCPATPLPLSDTQVTACRSHLWKFSRDYFVPRTLTFCSQN